MTLAVVPPLAAPAADAVINAARRAVAATGRRRLLLSGGVDPALAQAVAAALVPDGLEVEALAPDPLGIEDLAGRIGYSLAALVIQTPDVFGAARDTGLAAALCDEDGVVPIVVTADPAAVPQEARRSAAARLAARLRRVPGVRVVGRDAVTGVLIHLGEDRDGLAVVERLAGLVRFPPLALAGLFPGWPELRPVLVVAADPEAETADLDRLAAALADI